jgi:D-alanyl-lipoteichoic acid acyltransferase DltB (MBOAT superfamily)
MFAAGLSLFGLGLFKKLLIADQLAPISDAGFAATATGARLAIDQAWTALAAYAGQIYFDFSGYCDMAMGLAAMMGVRLAVNFHSPYKAASPSEFWQRWHITLSHFLRDYIYIPLGGGRVTALRRSGNLMLTMLIGGVWHGAGYTFVLWGLIHGTVLALSHVWRNLRTAVLPSSVMPRPVGWLFTFVVIMLAWVPFRAPSLEAAGSMYNSILPGSAAVWQADQTRGLQPAARSPRIGRTAMLFATCCLGFAVLAPSNADIFRRVVARRALRRFPVTRSAALLTWLPTTGWAIATGITLAISLLQSLAVAPSPFLYFQF